MKRRAFLRTLLLSIGFAFSFNVWKPTVQLVQEAHFLSRERVVKFEVYVQVARHQYGPYVN